MISSFAVVPLAPGPSGLWWWENLDIIVAVIIFAAIVASGIVNLVCSRKRNKFCPCCRTETELAWRTEKVDARKQRVTFGGKRMISGTVTQITPTIRCPQCGWEIDLGKS